MEPTRGESCPPGPRRGDAAPGEDPFLDDKSFQISTTPTTRDENGDSPGRYRSAPCGYLNPTGWLLIGWGSWSQRAGRVAPRANVNVPPHPGRMSSHPPTKKSFPICTTPTNRGRKCTPPRSIPPRTVWKPQPHWHLADWLGLMEPARRESCPSGQRQRSAAPGEDNF